MVDRKAVAIQEIQDIVGTKEVLCLVSGGVDSSVCAALLNTAIGADRVHAVHVNNGFMREKESDGVKVELRMPHVACYMSACSILIECCC